MSDIESLLEDDEIISHIVELPEAEELQILSHTLVDANIKDMKEELHEIVKDFKGKEVLPNVVAELIVRNELNTMVLDLYDYDKGYAISFRKYGDDKEMFHGEYSYAVSLIEYVRDGEIPYEVFDNLCKYNFKIFYDGYAVCQLRIHFGQEDSMRSHFILLKPSIQTIDAECSMKCKADSSLNFEEERARLISNCSLDLCLDPDPIVAEIITLNELNQYPFLTPFLKDIILKEKVRREKGVAAMKKPMPQESAPRNLKIYKPGDWNFRLNNPEPEEVELAKLESNLVYKDSLPTYLRERPICFPDKKSFTGFHVEIESFVYEYVRYTDEGEDESITDKFCISVLDDKEFYYGIYRLDEKMKEKRMKSCNWWKIGGREALDTCVKAFTREEMRLSSGGMTVTHYRMFNEQTKYSDGRTRTVRQKLAVPVSQVVLHDPQPSFEEETEKMDVN